MDFYKEAKKIKDEIAENRRYFHKNAEVGLEMPLAQEYVIKKLTEYGFSPEKCGNGVTAQSVEKVTRKGGFFASYVV